MDLDTHKPLISLVEIDLVNSRIFFVLCPEVRRASTDCDVRGQNQAFTIHLVDGEPALSHNILKSSVAHSGRAFGQRG